MATNSWTRFPFDVESDFPCPAIWTGLTDPLVNNRSAKVMGFQQVFWELVLCGIPSGFPVTTLFGAHASQGGHVKVLWSTASAEPSIQVTSAQVTWEGRSLQMIPAPSHLSLPSGLGLPSSSPRYYGAKTSHPCCALTEFLTCRICEHNKMAVVSHH